MSKSRFITFFVSVLCLYFLTSSVLVQSTTSSAVTGNGDACGNGGVTADDIKCVLSDFLKNLTNTSDQYSDGKINSLDYSTVRKFLLISLSSPSPTPRATPRPTPTASPTIAPSPLPSGGAYRAFSNDSYWNVPFPASAPLDAHTAEYITDSQNSSHTQNYLAFSAAPGNNQDFGWPSYWPTSSDPLYTLSSSPLVQVRIPMGAQPSSGSDGELNIFDLTTNQNVAMWRALYNSLNNTWSYSGLSRYMLSSNGLDKSAALSNDTRNFGHRGIPGAVRGIRVDEVRAGAINHRLECFWWATGTRDASYYWPMTGDEGDKGGIVPEGIVIRIKHSINLSTKGLSAPALVIARALQQYGCLIGDNSGSGNRVKLELNETAWQNMGLTYGALSSIPWSDWEFIQGGYKP